MPKAKRKPPSRERYERSHPTVSARVSIELYEKLNETREKTGKSYADILKEGLGVQKPITRKAYDRGYKAGYNAGKRAGKREGEIVLLGRCTKCGGLIKWDLARDHAKHLLTKIINEAGIQHGECG